ncbi:MAG: hypothetical protein OXL38_09805, partial [Gammaproteobacteria bacterium]|nr:hypothetical protein [Gammaproteobacteria bacterium]
MRCPQAHPQNIDCLSKAIGNELEATTTVPTALPVPDAATRALEQLRRLRPPSAVIIRHGTGEIEICAVTLGVNCEGAPKQTVVLQTPIPSPLKALHFKPGVTFRSGELHRSAAVIEVRRQFDGASAEPTAIQEVATSPPFDASLL